MIPHGYSIFLPYDWELFFLKVWLEKQTYLACIIQILHQLLQQLQIYAQHQNHPSASSIIAVSILTRLYVEIITQD